MLTSPAMASADQASVDAFMHLLEKTLATDSRAGGALQLVCRGPGNWGLKSRYHKESEVTVQPHHSLSGRACLRFIDEGGHVQMAEQSPLPLHFSKFEPFLSALGLYAELNRVRAAFESL